MVAKRSASVRAPSRPANSTGSRSGSGKVTIQSGGKTVELDFDLGTDITQIRRSVEMALTLSGRLGGTANRLQTSVEEVIAYLDVLGRATPAGAAMPGRGLTREEEDVLREAGSLQVALPPLAERASVSTADRLQRLLADALTAKQAAAALDLSPGRIRQLIGSRGVLAVQGAGGWKLPRFQFVGDSGGRIMRGLDKILEVLPADVHPLAVQAFLEQPHPDLDIDGEPHAPKAWLEGGGSVERVVELARDLHRLP